MKGRFGVAAAIAASLSIAAATAGLAGSTRLIQISSDPFTNSTSAHRTEVEPDTFSFGSTIVSAFQQGRFFNGGGSDIGFSTSQDGGKSWTHGSLPGLTFQVDPSSPYERVSDASVAFDAAHNVWLISSIPLLPSTAVPTVFVNRSTDGGLTWSNPVAVVPVGSGDYDKNWSVCDNTPTSPFFGNCYTEFDNFAAGDLELMSTSTDGGSTWGPARSTPDTAHGLGGQPLVQPNGTVIVPFEEIGPNSISAFRSTDGGASWSSVTRISKPSFHGVNGNLRTSPLPSAEIDASGRVFVAWEDCRFEQACKSNDIVFSASDNGTTWSPVTRVPIDSVGSGVDHFIPGIAVDNASSAATGGARIGLGYYYYANANCTVETCQLNAGFVSSTNGGVTWGQGQELAGPMSLTWIARTSQGFMVGDYISTSFSGGRAFPVVAVATAPNASGVLNEAMYAPRQGLDVVGGSVPASAAGASSTTSTSSPSTRVR
jgi:hypothetical protein